MNQIITLGMAGCGRIATRFVKEIQYVKDIRLTSVCGLDEAESRLFAEKNSLPFYYDILDKLLDTVDAIYIATPHLIHYEYIKKALNKGRHVLCEKPMVLSASQASELFSLAEKKKLVLLEALKTAFTPGFIELVRISKSGLIGKIKSVDATFTKLVEGPVRELQKESAGGSMTELSSYPLLAAVKLLGADYKSAAFYSYYDDNKDIDLFSRITLEYPGAIFTGKVGLGIKSEGDLIVSGTKGYLYVPAPWWKTESFEARFEDLGKTEKFFFEIEGDGLRYEIAEFARLVRSGERSTDKLREEESLAIISVIERFLLRDNINYI